MLLGNRNVNIHVFGATNFMNLKAGVLFIKALF